MFILGDITFQNCIRSDQNKKFYFAGLEGTFLALNSKNEIEEIEHEGDSYIQDVADSPENFLKILLVYAEYMKCRYDNLIYLKEDFIQKCNQISFVGNGFYKKLFWK